MLEDGSTGCTHIHSTRVEVSGRERFEDDRLVRVQLNEGLEEGIDAWRHRSWPMTWS